MVRQDPQSAWGAQVLRRLFCGCFCNGGPDETPLGPPQAGAAPVPSGITMSVPTLTRPPAPVPPPVIVAPGSGAAAIGARLPVKSQSPAPVPDTSAPSVAAQPRTPQDNATHPRRPPPLPPRALRFPPLDGRSPDSPAEGPRPGRSPPHLGMPTVVPSGGALVRPPPSTLPGPSSHARGRAALPAIELRPWGPGGDGGGSPLPRPSFLTPPLSALSPTHPPPPPPSPPPPPPPPQPSASPPRLLAPPSLPPLSPATPPRGATVPTASTTCGPGDYGGGTGRGTPAVVSRAAGSEVGDVPGSPLPPSCPSPVTPSTCGDYGGVTRGGTPCKRRGHSRCRDHVNQTSPGVTTPGGQSFSSFAGDGGVGGSPFTPEVCPIEAHPLSLLCT